MNSPPSEGPQVVIPTYPETHPHQESYSTTYANPNLSPMNNVYYTSPVESQHLPQTSPPPKGDSGSHSQSAIDTPDKPRRIPIWLSLLLAFFVAAAIGLAAALGIEMNRDPEVVEAKPVDITNGCAENGTDFDDTYLTKFYKPVKYDKFCNKDAPNEPLFSLFAGSFHNCIEACNNWNNYPLSIRQSSNRTTQLSCEAVSFVAPWADIGFAKVNNASGDCWLKPGPQKVGDLGEVNGTHAALVSS